MGISIDKSSVAAVPAANSTANTNISDVVGSKLDTHDGNSIYGRVGELYDQFQVERKCYPTLAAGATVVSAAGAWNYGNYAVVVPANTITKDYHILHVIIETSTVGDGVFQLGLYKGALDELVTEIRFSITGGFYGNSVYMVGSEEVEANSQIRARLASSVGAATITASVIYLEHLT
jgi:hypothetical protein